MSPTGGAKSTSSATARYELHWACWILILNYNSWNWLCVWCVHSNIFAYQYLIHEGYNQKPRPCDPLQSSYSKFESLFCMPSFSWLYQFYFGIIKIHKAEFCSTCILDPVIRGSAQQGTGERHPGAVGAAGQHPACHQNAQGGKWGLCHNQCQPGKWQCPGGQW